MQKLGPGSCFTDAAEAPILRIFWNKKLPRGVRLVDRTGLQGLGYF